MKKNRLLVLTICLLPLMMYRLHAVNSINKSGTIYYQKAKYKPGSKQKERIITTIVKQLDDLFPPTETDEKKVLKIDFFKYYSYKNPKTLYPYPTPMMICTLAGDTKAYPITSEYEANGSIQESSSEILKKLLNTITEKFVIIAQKLKEGYDVVIPYPTEKSKKKGLFHKKKASAYYNQEGEQDIFNKLGKTYVKDMSLFIQKHVFYLQSMADHVCVIDYYNHEKPDSFCIDQKETERVKRAYIEQFAIQGGLALKKERKIIMPNLDSDDEAPNLLPLDISPVRDLLFTASTETSTELPASMVTPDEAQTGLNQIIPVSNTHGLRAESPHTSPIPSSHTITNQDSNTPSSSTAISSVLPTHSEESNTHGLSTDSFIPAKQPILPDTTPKSSNHTAGTTQQTIQDTSYMKPRLILPISAVGLISGYGLVKKIVRPRRSASHNQSN